MHTETQTIRVGDWVDGVDPTYDFEAWIEKNAGSNPAYMRERVTLLRRIEAALAVGLSVEASAYGGWLRYYRRVFRIGMWDGWPYWAPTPTILTEIDPPIGTACVEKIQWMRLTSALIDGVEVTA